MNLHELLASACIHKPPCGKSHAGSYLVTHPDWLPATLAALSCFMQLSHRAVVTKAALATVRQQAGVCCAPVPQFRDHGWHVLD